MLLNQLLEFGKGPTPTGVLQNINSRLEPEIKIALDRVDDGVVRELVRTILNEILKVFDRLSLVESNLSKTGHPSRESFDNGPPQV